MDKTKSDGACPPSFSSAELCSICHGEGGWEAAASSTNYFWKTCPDCNGTGKANDGREDKKKAFA